MANQKAHAQKKNPTGSSEPPLRAKPIPRRLIRTNYGAELVCRGGSHGAMLSMEAASKLPPGRFFALIAAVLGEG